MNDFFEYWSDFITGLAIKFGIIVAVCRFICIVFDLHQKSNDENGMIIASFMMALILQCMSDKPY